MSSKLRQACLAGLATTAPALVILTGCSDSTSGPIVFEPPSAVREPLVPIDLDGKIGERRTLDPMVVARAHWGGNSSSQQEFVYEPPAGWVVYAFEERLISKYGDSWYTPQLLTANAAYAGYTEYLHMIDELEKTAGEYKNTKALAELQSARTNYAKWSSAFTSANNALHIKWGGRSEKVRVAGITVDTKTASLNLDVVITIARTMSKAELELLSHALKQRIARGESIAAYIATA